MSLLKAGANYHKFLVSCVVDVLQFSVTAMCPKWDPGI